MLPRPYVSHPVAAVEAGERAACVRLQATRAATHLDGEARSLFRRVYVRGSRVSTRFVCPRITGPTKAFKASVGIRPSSAYVKGCRTPVRYLRLRRTRPAGVGQTSGEETARGAAGAGAGDVAGASAGDEEAVVADAVEALGQDVDEEAVDELVGGQGHDLLPVASFGSVVRPREARDPSETAGVRFDRTGVHGGIDRSGSVQSPSYAMCMTKRPASIRAIPYSRVFMGPQGRTKPVSRHIN